MSNFIPPEWSDGVIDILRGPTFFSGLSRIPAAHRIALIESANAWLARHLRECNVRDCATCAKAREKGDDNG